MQQKLIWNTQLAAKSDLASLKAELDKIDVDTLKTVPSDLRKLSNVVDNVAKKLITEVTMVHLTDGLVLKTQCNTDKLGIEKQIDDAGKKIPDTGVPVKETNYNAKIIEIEGKCCWR